MPLDNANLTDQTPQDGKIPSQGGFISMINKTVNSLAGMKNYLSFILTLICILGSLALGWFKGVDQTVLLPSLLGLYVLGRAGQKSVAMFAASKDPNCDTENVINSLNNVETKSPKIQD